MNKLNENYHTHTTFCDGKATPEAYILKAIELGFVNLGFSAHAPVPFENEWSLKEENVESYVNEIRKLKEKYKNQINIFLGLEIDYIPNLSASFDSRRNSLSLDYVIGSVHLVKSNSNEKLWFIDGPEEGYAQGINTLFPSIQEAVQTYYHQIQEMIINEKPDIVGHFDKVRMYNTNNKYFDGNVDWYKESVINTLEVFKAHNTIVEINTRGIYRKGLKDFFPETWIIKECVKRNIKLQVNSDAHQPAELNGHFDETYNILKDLGIKIN